MSDTHCTPTVCKMLADHVPECWDRAEAKQKAEAAEGRPVLVLEPTATACPDCAAARVADSLMGREAIPHADSEDNPGGPRRRRLARATLDKWHGEPDEQENAVTDLLFHERQRGIDALEDAIQDVLTAENVRRAADGTPDDVEVTAGQWGVHMDAGRLRVRLMKRFFEHLAGGRDLNGKARA